MNESERDLLDLAAKAAGYDVRFGPGYLIDAYDREKEIAIIYSGGNTADEWNPLTDDGDALRLAVALRFTVATPNPYTCIVKDSEGHLLAVELGDDPYATTRYAIVKAAAVIAEQSLRKKS